jgi:hypothetical protein
VGSTDEFLARHGEQITADQIFLPTDKPLEPGTEVKFELLLDDRTTFLSGKGTITSAGGVSSSKPGMLLRFDQLSDEHAQFVSQLIDKVGAGEVDLSSLEGDDELTDGEDTRPDARPFGFGGWPKKT